MTINAQDLDCTVATESILKTMYVVPIASTKRVSLTATVLLESVVILMISVSPTAMCWKV